MFVIILSQTNLVIGTLARHLTRRPDLKLLMDQLLLLEVGGIFLITERGHGLDAFNIETTATEVPDGFVLNTPREEATKSVSN